MKAKKILPIITTLALITVSCGEDGYPGYCYISIDWEYFGANYRVSYYEDNNRSVPSWENLEPTWYYDSRPGTYDYYYESEDPRYYYDYTGSYTLYRDEGTPGGLFEDGLDGADTYFDLFLPVVGKKGLGMEKPTMKATLQPDKKYLQDILPRAIQGVITEPVRIEKRNWEMTKGAWTIRVDEVMRTYLKSSLEE